MLDSQSSFNFDELFVVSDLHFGGESGFQIFASTKEMLALIEHIAALPLSVKAALLINGDFIDFLAEKPQRHFDPEGAPKKLDRIAADDTFKPIFEALSQLLGTPKRTLVVNLGNHDLELAMPWVREHLIRLLCDDDAAKRGRLLFCMDGTGVRCRVGRCDVVVLHGNEFDSWNVADYHHMRTMARDYQFGKLVEDWEPNAGSRMVIEVMNEIKATRPFVDLLKPEKQGVIKALGILAPTYLKRLKDLSGVGARAVMDAGRMKMDLLSVEANAELFLTKPTTHEDEFLEAICQDPTEMSSMLIAQSQDAEMLGIAGAIWANVRGKSDCETMRVALQELQKDQSFSLLNEDDTYKSATSAIAADVPFVITGHTHLMRAISRPRGGYFNSGTWARLIQVQPANLANETSFEPIFRVLQAKTLDALDAIQDQNGLSVVQKLCPVVHLKSSSGGTTGRIFRVQLGGGPIDLEIPNTRLQG
jgi:UDP-2,3-diacylglucosamine pyrophosphatase LpxH